jgi:hypothetical protein
VEQALSDAKKEQIKLRATFVNNIGIGVILVGVLTPVIRAMYEPAALSGHFTTVVITMTICFSVGWILHFTASNFLRELSK